jgi:outer membrane protein assembly factor BamB
VEMVNDADGSLITYTLSNRNRLRLELPGFEPLVRDIESILDAETKFTLRKNTRWVFAGNGPFESTPVVSGETLYIAGRDRNLYAISTEDGQVRFSVPLGIFGDTSSTVAVVRDRVIVGTARGEILGVTTGLGSLVWRRDLGNPITGALVPSPDGTSVLVNDMSGSTTALEAASGRVLWTREVSAAPGSAPTVRGDDVYVGSDDLRRITILAMADGRELSTVPVGTSVATTPVVEGSYVCVGSDDFTVHALNADTKQTVASFCTNGEVKARPVLIRGNVYVGSTDGEMYACRVAGGEKTLWSARLGKPILGAATVTDEHVFVGCTGGVLYCLDVKDGTVLWRFKTGGKIVSQPIVVENTLYVSSMDGNIYAIALD